MVLEIQRVCVRVYAYAYGRVRVCVCVYGVRVSVYVFELVCVLNNQVQLVLLSGVQFDKFGNHRVWWDNETMATFQSLKSCMVDQYDAYEVLGSHVSVPGTAGGGAGV